MPTLVHSFFVTDTIELAFQLAELNGNFYGDIRQFCHSERYTGPTKHGLFFRLDQLKELRNLVGQNQDLIMDGKVEEKIGEIPYKNTSVAIISLVESTLDDHPVCIDIREHVNSSQYAGFTRKGFRIATSQLDEFLQGLDILVAQLENRTPNQ